MKNRNSKRQKNLILSDKELGSVGGRKQIVMKSVKIKSLAQPLGKSENSSG